MEEGRERELNIKKRLYFIFQNHARMNLSVDSSRYQLLCEVRLECLDTFETKKSLYLSSLVVLTHKLQQN